MAYRLRAGESKEDAAQALLGDARLVNELDIIQGVAYVKGEKTGPPSSWGAKPNTTIRPPGQDEGHS